MKFHIIKFIIAISCLSFFSSNVHAQDTPDLASGLTPYGSFQGGDIDSINLPTGNLFVHIPIIGYPQRGGKLRLNFQLMGNGKNLAAYQICPTKTDCFYTWTVHNSPLSLADDQKVAFGSAILQIHVGSHIVDMGEYSVVTPDGSVHPTVTAGRVTLPLNQNPTAGPEWSIDATGFFSNASDNVNPTFQMDRDGIRYFYGTTTPPPIFREDSNGNQIVEPAPNYNTYTDTVGRTVAQPPSPGTDITTNYSGCSRTADHYIRPRVVGAGAKWRHRQFQTLLCDHNFDYSHSCNKWHHHKRYDPHQYYDASKHCTPEQYHLDI